MYKLGYLLAATIMAVFCLSCAPRALNLDDVRFLCMQGDESSLTSEIPGATCESRSRRDICDRYQAVASMEYESEAQCLAACGQARDELARRFLMEDCSRVLYDGESLCRRYCQGHYGQ